MAEDNGLSCPVVDGSGARSYKASSQDLAIVVVESQAWIGQEVAHGRYRIERKLGEGGMGHVFLAYDNNIDNHVVIKAPRRSLLEDEAAVNRFAREIRSMVKLEHPHIVRVTDVGQFEGLPFCVMQYLAGGSLDDRREEFSNSASVLRWIPQVCAALDFVHEQGYVHRDVKPANILFDAYGNVFLSDFGIAKGLAEIQSDDTNAGSITGTGMIVGTPNYMAPELVRCDPYDGSVDQYAMAAAIFELLSGEKLFEGVAPGALLVMQVTDTPRPLHEAASHVPASLSKVIAKALEKSSDKRYSSCCEFEQAVREALEGKASPTRVTNLPVAPAPIAHWEPTAEHRSPEDDTTPKTDLTIPPSPAPIRHTPTGAHKSPLPSEPVAPAPLSLERQPPVPPPTFAHRQPPSAGQVSALRPGSSLSNSIGMGFSHIPAGEFWMGSPTGELERYPDEGPQQLVKMTKPFWMGIHEVTVGQFQKFVQDTGYKTQAEVDEEGGWGYNNSDNSFEGPDPRFHWKNVGWRQTGAHPVVNVTWFDAVDFCKWLSRVDGQLHRLPTEAEWEYACRAGSTSSFSYGPTLDSTQANFREAEPSGENSTEAGRTAPVGSYKPNDWGLYDMHGNAWEWCYDGKRDYSSDVLENPIASTDANTQKVLRGGAWSGKARFCRSATRFIGDTSNRSCNTGFRIIMIPRS